MCRTVNYNSNERTDYIELEAPYYNAIYPYKITFEKEEVIATIDSLGHIEFYDMDGKSLGFVDLPVSDDPSEKAHTAQYGNARCKSGEEQIRFQLPVYDWKDYYPHCDGESDRWDRFIVCWFDVVFDCKTNQIAVLNK